VVLNIFLIAVHQLFGGFKFPFNFFSLTFLFYFFLQILSFILYSSNFLFLAPNNFLFPATKAPADLFFYSFWYQIQSGLVDCGTLILRLGLPPYPSKKIQKICRHKVNTKALCFEPLVKFCINICSIFNIFFPLINHLTGIILLLS
jgi:hypothetical protein